MRKLVALAFLGLVALTGCSGMVENSKEIAARERQVVAIDFRQATDDWESILLLKRQSRLTEWYVR